MLRRTFLQLAAASLAATALPARAEDTLIVISNSPLPKTVNDEALKRIYTGRAFQVEGMSLRPVNLAPNQPLRQKFLRMVLQQEDEDYTAYWTVRKYIGQGTPPRELGTAAEVIDFVNRTPGALGYVGLGDLRGAPVNEVLRR
jgi:ABC-type phosphate transport system substrate-binding protein